MDMAIAIPQGTLTPQDVQTAAGTQTLDSSEFGALLAEAQTPRQPAAEEPATDQPGVSTPGEKPSEGKEELATMPALPPEMTYHLPENDVFPIISMGDDEGLAGILRPDPLIAKGPELSELFPEFVQTEPAVEVQPEAQPELAREFAVLQDMELIKAQPESTLPGNQPPAIAADTAETANMSEAGKAQTALPQDQAVTAKAETGMELGQTAEKAQTGPMAGVKPVQPQAQTQLAAETQDTLETVFVPTQTANAPLFEPQPLDVEQPEFSANFAETVLQKTDAGVTQFDIALYPKELGKVTVNVQIQAGQAVLTFICESAKSQNILNSHAGAIGSLVEQNTGKQTVVEVPDDHSQHQQGQESYEGHNGNQQRQQQEGQKRPQREQVGFFIDQLKSTMLVG